MESVYTTIISNIQKSLGNVLGWIIDSVIEQNISILKYNPLAGSSYIKLSKQLDYLRERLINIHNRDDNKSFKWCLVRYLHPKDQYPARITKAEKDVFKKPDFHNIKFLVETRDIEKLEKKFYRH